MIDDPEDKHDALQDSFDDFLEHSLCGYITTNAEGVMIKANTRFAEWLGVAVTLLEGQLFSDRLSMGGKIYWETHLWPLLRMQGFFDEVALELKDSNGQRLPVLVNAYERRDKNNLPLFIRITVFKARDRRQYEENLQLQNRQMEADLLSQRNLLRLREQLIAILGHDLRNPLGAIISGTDILLHAPLDPAYLAILQVLKRSSGRMRELIKNIMDFARTRLGEGIVVEVEPTEMEPVLQQVVDELRSQNPSRKIEAEYDLDEPVHCDGNRIAQLFSNLLANALTHGDPDTPVYVKAYHRAPYFELSVMNHGQPIPPDRMEQLFEPFSREGTRPSINGLGLGLYIASQISSAHNASLTCTSDENETRFTFKMNY